MRVKPQLVSIDGDPCRMAEDPKNGSGCRFEVTLADVEPQLMGMQTNFGWLGWQGQVCPGGPNAVLGFPNVAPPASAN
jgi:hypothetical protein